jgi:hypothetical protein
MEAREGRDAMAARCQAGTTARLGDAGRRKDNLDRIAELPKCEASGTRNTRLRITLATPLRFKLLVLRVTEFTGF